MSSTVVVIVACYSHSLGTIHCVMARLPACIVALYKKLPFSSILGASHSITEMKWGSRTVELHSMV